MGLGASAAVVVAITRAFNQLLKLGLNDDAVNDLAFECEKLAHGDPSGVDNTLAVYGQPILFQKNKHADVRELSLAEAPPLVVAASGRRGVTRELVLGVRKLYERNKALYGMILEEMDEIAVAGAAQLISRDYEALGALMNVCHGLLNALQVSTPELEKMVSIARAHGACGAKLTGAGGGGSIVALCPGAVKDVSAALSTAGYQIVRSAESKL